MVGQAVGPAHPCVVAQAPELGAEGYLGGCKRAALCHCVGTGVGQHRDGQRRRIGRDRHQLHVGQADALAGLYRCHVDPSAQVSREGIMKVDRLRGLEDLAVTLPASPSRYGEAAVAQAFVTIGCAATAADHQFHRLPVLAGRQVDRQPVPLPTLDREVGRQHGTEGIACNVTQAHARRTGLVDEPVTAVWRLRPAGPTCGVGHQAAVRHRVIACHPEGRVMRRAGGRPLRVAPQRQIALSAALPLGEGEFANTT